jgi:spore maturation protein CgeB
MSELGCGQLNGNRPAPPVRAVVATDLVDWSTGAGVVVGLRLQGWLVHTIDLRSCVPTADGLLLKVASRALRRQFCAAYNDRIIEACSRSEADVFLTVKGDFIAAQTIQKLNNRGIVTAVYYPDFHFDYRDFDKRLIDEVGLFITTKSFQMQWLKERRGDRPSAHVPHGYPPLVQMSRAEPPEEKAYEYDIAYIGNPCPSKVELLIKVCEAHSSRKIVVAGNGWERAARGSALEPFVMHHPVVGDMLADLHRRSRINLAVHWQPIVNDWSDFVSRRTFEIPASRGFMLHVDNAEVRSTYDVPAEIDVFVDAADLNQKITYYLAKPGLRRQMLDRAFLRAVPDYGHDRRGIMIAELIEPLVARLSGSPA